MHTLTARTLTAFALTLCLPLPAIAAPAINQAGADALKPRVEKTIADITQTLRQSGMDLKQTGTLAVEPAGTYYAVTTPSFVLDMPAAHLTRTVGMLAINAIPTDDPDLVKVALALPTPMTDAAKTGQPVGVMTIGNQNLSGLWHLTAQSFVQLDAAYKDIRVADTLQNTNLDIPALTATMNLTHDTKGLWSGPTHMQASGIAYTAPDQTLRIATLTMDNTVTGLDLMARKNLNAQTAASGNTWLQTALARLSDSVQSNLSATNIGIQSPSGTTTIQTLTASSSGENLRGQFADVEWNAVAQDIATTNTQWQPFMPTRITVKAALHSFSPADLAAAISSTQKVPLLPVLEKTKAVLNIASIVLDAPSYGIEANGNFHAEKGMAVGRAHIAIRGVAELLAGLTGPQAQQGAAALVPPAVLGMLTAVQMTGKPVTDAQGRQALTYDLQILPDGRKMLNGADISALTQALSAPSAQQKTPAKK